MEPINLYNINRFFDWVTRMDIKRLDDVTPEEWNRLTLGDMLKKKMAEKEDIRSVLNEREQAYGDYSDVSSVSQRIKDAMRDTDNWNDMFSFQKESLDMIANKISRIVNGDPDYLDSWVDIVGYAQLVVDRMENK